MAEPTETPLQSFLRKAVAEAPRARDFYDKQIQKITGSKGKAIYDLQRGKSSAPNTATLKHIANVLGQPLELLVRAAEGEAVDPVPSRYLPPEGPTHATSDHVPVIKSEDGSVPLRHLDLSLSMGDGTTLEDYYEEGVFEFDAALLRRISRAPAYRLIVGQGVGDSMMPTLLNEDMVIFDTTQTVLNAMDKIWAISIYGQGAVKRLRRISADRVLVISDNPTVGSHEYPVEDVRILGRVIWSARRH